MPAKRSKWNPWIGVLGLGVAATLAVGVSQAPRDPALGRRQGNEAEVPGPLAGPGTGARTPQVLDATGTKAPEDDAAHPTESACFGTPRRGRLEHGWALPGSGTNFVPYSAEGVRLGRTFVHSAVYRAVLAAYASLAQAKPEQRFVYGETGLATGGPFPPHKTHQAGTSVDFMIPVMDSEGAPRLLPTHSDNLWGYGIDFDEEGRSSNLRIDFNALAAHLEALDHAAKNEGIPITKVVLYPPLQQKLRQTEGFRAIAHLPFTTREAWVRHDDHYHVDFGVPCAPHAPHAPSAMRSTTLSH